MGFEKWNLHVWKWFANFRTKNKALCVVVCFFFILIDHELCLFHQNHVWNLEIICFLYKIVHFFLYFFRCLQTHSRLWHFTQVSRSLNLMTVCNSSWILRPDFALTSMQLAAPMESWFLNWKNLCFFVKNIHFLFTFLKTNLEFKNQTITFAISLILLWSSPLFLIFFCKSSLFPTKIIGAFGQYRFISGAHNIFTLS